MRPTCRTGVDVIQSASGRTGVIALSSGLLTAIAAGLIGVGGGEFRIPVLVQLLGFPLKLAAAVNLVIGLFTVILGVLRRGGMHAWTRDDLDRGWFAGFSRPLSRLRSPLPVECSVWPAAKCGFLRCSICLRSPIKEAGTLSLMVSIPTVAAGALMDRRLGRIPNHVLIIASAMGVASAVGVLLGAALLPYVNREVIKGALGDGPSHGSAGALTDSCETRTCAAAEQRSSSVSGCRSPAQVYRLHSD
jgi:hypothetical protein